MPSCKDCRKFGTKLFLKGDRCNGAKCTITRRNYRPGQHGAKTNIRKSEYGLQLLEKQKAKFEYGLRETQFSNIFKKASKSKENTGEELLKLLEERFDNIVYRLGWAVSRAQARQMITHRQFKLNGKPMNIPSVTLKVKDKVAPVSKEKIKQNKVTLPEWLKVDPKGMEAEVVSEPVIDEAQTDIDSQLIIEFYSR